MTKRVLIIVHRWLGVALCGLFLLWFSSGIGMMYWSFPTVTPADRLERAPALTPATVLLSPIEAATNAGIDHRSVQTRLSMFDGRPVYRFTVSRTSERLVYADTGEEQHEVSRALMDRVAGAWTRQPLGISHVESVDEVDQWTVQGPLRALRPMWKYSWANGEELYISGLSGEVVQYTTTASRIGAYLGPIPHWFYFTPLRKHQGAWASTVIWTSGGGTVMAILGLAIGIWVYSPSKRYRYAGASSSIPYRGQKRWHMVLGLVFGVAAATWAFSGMLSMDPFPTQTSGSAGTQRAEPSVAEALRGRPALSAFGAMHPGTVLEQLRGLEVKELELTSFVGKPLYMATLASGRTKIVSVDGHMSDAFDEQDIIGVVKRVAPSSDAVDVRVVQHYDRYYLDRHRRLPLPIILALMNDAKNTRHYIDPATGRVVATYDDRNWVSRWLYSGMHSLNFPWLYNHRPLWDIVMITCMTGGTALSVTSLVLAWQVLRRKSRVRCLGSVASTESVMAHRF